LRCLRSVGVFIDFSNEICDLDSVIPLLMTGTCGWFTDCHRAGK
jgi:hypothetical protein